MRRILVAPGRYRLAPPCRHLGQPTGETVVCPTCPGTNAEGSVRVKTFACDRYGSCTAAKPVPGLGCCEDCPDYADPAMPDVQAVVRLSPHLLPGQTFNCSIAEFRGRTYLAYRYNWTQSRIVVCELGPDLLPRGPQIALPLGRLSEDQPAQEDPRLFVHGDQLHVAYTGYAPAPGTMDYRTSLCIARLSAAGTDVEHCWAPAYTARQAWEKNWGCFGHEGRLLAVHSITPHRVLDLEGGDAYPYCETRWTPAWHSGELRGGASPCRVGDEYWSFFHGFLRSGQEAHYACGLYCFEARPPFRPTRFSPTPLLLPDRRDRPPGQLANVVYPGGAMLRDGLWWIACGSQDHEACLYALPARQVEGLLREV